MWQQAAACQLTSTRLPAVEGRWRRCCCAGHSQKQHSADHGKQASPWHAFCGFGMSKRRASTRDRRDLPLSTLAVTPWLQEDVTVRVSMLVNASVLSRTCLCGRDRVEQAVDNFKPTKPQVALFL